MSRPAGEKPLRLVLSAARLYSSRLEEQMNARGIPVPPPPPPTPDIHTALAEAVTYAQVLADTVRAFGLPLPPGQPGWLRI